MCAPFRCSPSSLTCAFLDVCRCGVAPLSVTTVGVHGTLVTDPFPLLLVPGLMRNVTPSDAHVRTGKFPGWQPMFYGGTLQGARVGILGFGKVGQEVARLMSVFTQDIVYYDTVFTAAAASLAVLICFYLSFCLSLSLSLSLAARCSCASLQL